ncbi:hypothetical protein FOCC_FOCC017883 [Frankliniella occidentalis]|nr:hypothetical protein FOCC_FOCC017883 [Frankliniella occidentalis]
MSRMPSWLLLLCCCAVAVHPAARAAPPEDAALRAPDDLQDGLVVEGFTDLPPTPPEPEPSTEAPEPPEPGCAPCRVGSCPRSAADCSTGLAPDPCGCCPRGVCGVREGARCYNASTNGDLAARALGVCGENMDCVTRLDLGDMVSEWAGGERMLAVVAQCGRYQYQFLSAGRYSTVPLMLTPDALLPQDKPEALCVCRDQGQVCGSDNTTYPSSCQMRVAGAAGGQDEPPVRVWLKHRGPCRAAPWIVTPPAPVQYVAGSPVSLECEVKGFPAPSPSWERISAEGIATPLPSDDASLVVMVRGGPEAFMASSWLQIMALRPEDVGTYICVATNSEGVARAAAELTILP